MDKVNNTTDRLTNSHLKQLVIKTCQHLWLMIMLTVISTTVAATTTISYYHNDHLGTPQALTDENQNVVWQASYDPFGKATITTETVTNNIRFPGQYFDVETNLHYNYFRTYDSATGRYVTSDPIGLAGGINTYGYALQNPTSYTDPHGLATQAIGYGIGRVVLTPSINLGIRYLTARRALTLGDWLYGVFNEADDGETDGDKGVQCPTDGNTNPYSGSVDSPVIVVDGNGNAIPVGEGESIGASPDGRWQEVKDINGDEIGRRIDNGHPKHTDPRGQVPHAHVPGATNPDGTAWLPLIK